LGSNTVDETAIEKPLLKEEGDLASAQSDEIIAPHEKSVKFNENTVDKAPADSGHNPENTSKRVNNVDNSAKASPRVMRVHVPSMMIDTSASEMKRPDLPQSPSKLMAECIVSQRNIFDRDERF
jgi:hypothetical protein